MVLQRIQDLIRDQLVRLAWSHHSHAGTVQQQLRDGLPSLAPDHRRHLRRALGATERIVFEMCCPGIWTGTYLEPYLESLSVADLRRIYSVILTLFTVLIMSRLPEEQGGLSQALRQLRIDLEMVNELEDHLRDLDTDEPRQLSRSTGAFVERILGVKWHPLVCGAYVIFVEDEWQRFPVPERV